MIDEKRKNTGEQKLVWLRQEPEMKSNPVKISQARQYDPVLQNEISRREIGVEPGGKDAEQ